MSAGTIVTDTRIIEHVEAGKPVAAVRMSRGPASLASGRPPLPICYLTPHAVLTRTIRHSAYKPVYILVWPSVQSGYPRKVRQRVCTRSAQVQVSGETA